MTDSTSFTHHAVVGFDGSANSAAALQWAFDHVRRLGGGTIKVVMSWSYAPSAMSGYGIGGSLPPAESMQEASEAALTEAREFLSGRPYVKRDGVRTVRTLR